MALPTATPVQLLQYKPYVSDCHTSYHQEKPLVQSLLQK